MRKFLLQRCIVSPYCNTVFTDALYEALLNQHRLIADVVAFRVSHINHLTPRTLDIDAVQAGMSARNEAVTFTAEDGTPQSGHHTVRFGEMTKTRAQIGDAPTEENAEGYRRVLGETFAALK